MQYSRFEGKCHFYHKRFKNTNLRYCSFFWGQHSSKKPESSPGMRRQTWTASNSLTQGMFILSAGHSYLKGTKCSSALKKHNSRALKVKQISGLWDSHLSDNSYAGFSP